MSVQTSTRPVALPQVNLVPPEIQENRDFHRLQAGLSVLVLLAIAGVGALYWQGKSAVNDAKASLAKAQATQRQLQSKLNTLHDVTETAAELQAAQATVDQVLSTNVRWSGVLVDFSTDIPSNVWYTSLRISENVSPASYPSSNAVPPTIGTITFSGTGKVQRWSPPANPSGWPVHDATADWLDSMNDFVYLRDATFSQSSEALIGTTPVANFTSTATVTSKALKGCDLKAVCK